jgi:hypothetical protein
MKVPWPLTVPPAARGWLAQGGLLLGAVGVGVGLPAVCTEGEGAWTGAWLAAVGAGLASAAGICAWAAR